jgi:hypothetical protein
MKPQAYQDLSTTELLAQRQVLLRRQREHLREWRAADARQKLVDEVLTSRGVALDRDEVTA